MGCKRAAFNDTYCLLWKRMPVNLHGTIVSSVKAADQLAILKADCCCCICFVRWRVGPRGSRQNISAISPGDHIVLSWVLAKAINSKNPSVLPCALLIRK